MKIAIFIADIEIRVGGSESYFASLFECLQRMYSDSEFEVITTFVDEDKRLSPVKLAEKLNGVFGTHVKPDFTIAHLPYRSAGSLNVLKGYLWYSRYTQKFDMCFNCTRNLMISKAKKNYAVIHFPVRSYANFNVVKKYTFLKLIANHFDRLWKKGYDKFLCNSEYTASWLKRIWKTEDSCMEILYPPVQLLEPQKDKKHQIFVCSRIERTKSLHILIKAFSELELNGVSLVIAGAKLAEDEDYYQELKRLSEGLNVQFVLNPSREELGKLYGSSAVFWHAKGLEVEEEKAPDLLEHFGITTVEAMSAGCVPVVINKGGQKEIVDEGVNGFKWNTTDELIEKTKKIFQMNDTSAPCENAVEKSKNYGIGAFSEKFAEIMESEYEK